MYIPKFELKSFEFLENESKQNILRALLEALIAADREWLSVYPNTPKLYEHNPQYVLKVRPFGLDSWQDIAQTISLRSGDCKDFACWRIAELRQAGYTDVSPFIKVGKVINPRNRSESITIYHIQVRKGVQIEDPSVILGMPQSVDFNQIRG